MRKPYVIYAHSISTQLATILAGNEQRLKVVSGYAHACNLQDERGAFIALVTPHYGNGPFHIVIPAQEFPRLTPNQQIFLSHNQLIGDHFAIQLYFALYENRSLTLESLPMANSGFHHNRRIAPAQRWNPNLPRLVNFSSSTLAYLLELFSASGLSTMAIGFHHVTSDRLAQTPYALRVQQGVAALLIGLTAENRQLMEEGVHHLAGLGPGLTPAGDDFLVGLLAALYAGGPLFNYKPWTVLQGQCKQIATIAARRTTTLSATWLTYAGQGDFGEAWHDLINRINQQETTSIAQAVKRILATGATSGADALSGFLWGMELMMDMANRGIG